MQPRGVCTGLGVTSSITPMYTVASLGHSLSGSLAMCRWPGDCQTLVTVEDGGVFPHSLPGHLTLAATGLTELLFLPYFQDSAQLQGPCLCQAACQEGTAPTGDVAAGCRFPLKPPGHDSRKAWAVLCFHCPAG